MTYYFVIEYCGNLKGWLLPEDTTCVDVDVAKAKANDLLVQVKRMNQNFSPKAYLDNNNELDSFFYTDKVTLSPTNANFNEWNIYKKEISYFNNKWYTDQLAQWNGASKTSLITYGMETSSASTLPYLDFGDSSTW